MTRSILALEFTGVDSAQTLNALLPPDPAIVVRRVDPLLAHFDRSTTIDEQARELCATVDDTADWLIVGYCSAARLGLAVAEAMHRRRAGSARTVLVEPDPVPPQSVPAELARIVRSLDPTAPEPSPDGSPQTVAERLDAHLAGARTALVRRHGDDDLAAELADYLLGRYRAWLRFLSACAAMSATAVGSAVSVVTGHAVLDLRPLVVEVEGVTVHHWGPAQPAALLTDPRTAALVEWLAHTTC